MIIDSNLLNAYFPSAISTCCCSELLMSNPFQDERLNQICLLIDLITRLSPRNWDSETFIPLTLNDKFPGLEELPTSLFQQTLREFDSLAGQVFFPSPFPIFDREEELFLTQFPKAEFIYLDTCNTSPGNKCSGILNIDGWEIPFSRSFTDVEMGWAPEGEAA